MAKKAQEAKKNHVAEVELLVEESLEAVIRQGEKETLEEGLVVIDNDISKTQRTIDNTPIGAALREAPENMVTPEKDRKKIGKTERMPDTPQETGNNKSESQSVTEKTGLCGGRRHISDLDSRYPKTGFPTK